MVSGAHSAAILAEPARQHGGGAPGPNLFHPGGLSPLKERGKAGCQSARLDGVGRLATPENLAAAERALASGATLDATAAAVGVSRRTRSRWLLRSRAAAAA
jgi:hypothetical protein